MQFHLDEQYISFFKGKGLVQRECITEVPSQRTNFEDFLNRVRILYEP